MKQSITVVCVCHKCLSSQAAIKVAEQKYESNTDLFIAAPTIAHHPPTTNLSSTAQVLKPKNASHPSDKSRHEK